MNEVIEKVGSCSIQGEQRIYTYMQLLTFQRAQTTDKDVLPWCDSSENLFGCFLNDTITWVVCVGMGLLAFPLQLALISDKLYVILIILVREQPWQMQFEIWGMQWVPKGRGLPLHPPKERSPGMYSQQNLECTSLSGYSCSTNHLPNNRLGRKSPGPLPRCLESCSLSSPSCLH